MVYLKHHGIKGQHWGERNGPPYPLSQKHKKIYKSFGKDDRDDKDKFVQKLKRKGIHEIDSDTYLMKKGSKVGRFTSNKNEKLNGNKYVFVTKDDKSAYNNMAKHGELGFKASKYYLNKYVTSKDLKILKGEKLADDLLKKYGNSKINKIWDELRASKAYSEYYKLTKMLSSGDKSTVEAGNYYKLMSYQVMWTLHKLMYEHPENLEAYAKKGYDAVVDFEDQVGGFEFPLIIFNSKRNLSRR